MSAAAVKFFRKSFQGSSFNQLTFKSLLVFESWRYAVKYSENTTTIGGPVMPNAFIAGSIKTAATAKLAKQVFEIYFVSPDALKMTP